MILTPARPADETQLDELIVYAKDVLHVFDRGYFNFEKFDAYSGNGIKFATRTKNNTVVNVIEELPVASSSSITRHAIVTIGKMKNHLQLVETTDSNGNEIRIVCNDAKRLFAETLAQYEIGDVLHLDNLTYDPLI